MEKLDSEFIYLAEMYADNYYPNFLVDKIRKEIEETVAYIDEGSKPYGYIQERFDKMTCAINGLIDEFIENDSDLETVASESIGETVDQILKYYSIDMNADKALREREW